MGGGIGSVKALSGDAASSDVSASHPRGGASNELAFAAALEKGGLEADGDSPGEEAQHGRESPAGLMRAGGLISPEALGGETLTPVHYANSLEEYFMAHAEPPRAHSKVDLMREMEPLREPGKYLATSFTGELYKVDISELTTSSDGFPMKVETFHSRWLEVREPVALAGTGQDLAKPGDRFAIDIYDYPSDSMSYGELRKLQPFRSPFEDRPRQIIAETGLWLAATAAVGAVQGQFQALSRGEDAGGVALAGAKGVAHVALPGLSHGYSDVIGDGDMTLVDRALNFANDASGTAFTAGAAGTLIAGVGAPAAAIGGRVNLAVNIIKAGMHFFGADGTDQNPGYVYATIAAIPQALDAAGEVAAGVAEQIASPDPEKTPMIP